MTPREVDEDEDLAARWEVVLDGVASTQRGVLSQIEAAGVPAQSFAVLNVLLRAPEHRMSMSRLARDLSMTSGGFTKLADRIAREGLIDRRASSGDRRVVYATLTDRGLQVARRAVRVYHSALRVRVLDVVSVADLTTLARLMSALQQANARETPDGEKESSATSSSRKREAASPLRPALRRPPSDRQGA